MENLDLCEARFRIAGLEDRLSDCRGMAEEVQRQGRHHLLATVDRMIVDAERLLATGREHLAMCLRLNVAPA
jgi:hypothetical protein